MTRCESDVMRAVFGLCDGTDGCLISPLDIMSVLPAGRRYSRERVDDALNSLKKDGYLDLVYSERKGERMYLISLKEGGLSFKRNALKRRNDILFKILLALISAAATFVFGALLKAVFKT